MRDQDANPGRLEGEAAAQAAYRQYASVTRVIEVVPLLGVAEELQLRPARMFS